MAIDPRSIDTDLTLELDEDEITVGEFTAALEHFIGLVREVGKRVAPKNMNPWLIRVYAGSAGVGLYPRPGAITANEAAVIRNSVIEGMEQLERGVRPEVFSDRAIEHAKDISAVFKSRKTPSSKIKIWSANERAYAVKREVEVTADKLLEPKYEDVGSIEGKLDVLSGHGKLAVVVYDPLDDRAIRCEVTPQQMEIALKSFRKRVEVFGTIRYRHDGTAVSVRVDDIIPFPSPEEIPPLHEIRGILRKQ
jgi:hypothetical protein